MAAFTDLVEGFLPSAPGNKEPSGLFITGKGDAVPLKSREVFTTVHCDTSFADTTETFNFISDEDVSVTFKFPLPPRSAVYKLAARVGDRNIVTEVKRKEEAREDFKVAVSQGHTAVIAQQESSTQIFTLELGNLEAMQEAVVSVSYVRLLDSIGGALEYVHTATWTPPYHGSAGDKARGKDVLLEQNPRFAQTVSYRISYRVTVMSHSRLIRAVESPGPVKVEEATLEGCVGAKVVTLSEEVADPSKDFTLLVDLAPEDTAAAAAAAQPGTVTTTSGRAQISLQTSSKPNPLGVGPPLQKTVALATFVPQTKAKNAKSAADTAGAGQGESSHSSHHPPLEIIFVVDCSGSMEGSRIEQAREAALFFIKDLPMNDRIRFNIVCFGSTHCQWSPSCQEYNEQSVKSAVQWVQAQVHANMGGTEILETFRAIYATPVTPGHTRQIIFLTDGGITGSEESAVFDLVGPKQAGNPTAAANTTPGGSSKAFGAAIGSRIKTLLGKGSDSGASGATHASSGAEQPTSGAPQAVAATEEGDKTAVAAAPPQKESVPAVLCLGIGHGVHKGLLDGMAAKTGGIALYVVDGESIVKKAGFLKKVALSSHDAIVNPKLVFRGAVVRAAPHVLPPRLFPDEPLHVLLELVKFDDAAVMELTGSLADGSSFSLPLPLKGSPKTEGSAYAVLHAMCWVGSLLSGTSPLHCNQDGSPLDKQPSSEEVKEAVVRAAVAENLVTPYTAAVGVMLQQDPLDPSQVKKVEVPLAVPHGAIHFQQSGMEREGQLFLCAGAAPPGMSFNLPAPALMTRCAMPMPRRPFAMAKQSKAMACAAPPPMAFGAAGSGAAPPPFAFGAPASGAAQATMAFGASGLPSMAFGAPSSGAAPPAFAFESAAPSAAADMAVDSTAAPGTLFGGGGRGFMQKESSSMGAGSMEGGQECLMDADMGAADSMGVDEEMLTPTAAGSTAAAKRSVPEMVSFLNLSRGVDGLWHDEEAVLTALAASVPTSDSSTSTTSSGEGGSVQDKVVALKTAKPTELSSLQWVAVLVLAFLRKHCGSMRGEVQGMEAKATAQLQQGWPAGAKPLGFAVLAAMKLL